MSSPSGAELAAGTFPDRIVPPVAAPRDDSLEGVAAWGFRDTTFQVLPNRSVMLTGGRYDLCGDELPSVVPWVEGQLEIQIDPRHVHVASYPPVIPEPRTNEAFVAELRNFLTAEAISTDPEARLRHGHGHTQEEIYALRYGSGLARVPDLIVYPAREEDIETLVELASRHAVSLVPYGGGTNVSGALTLPEDEVRMVVVDDLARLNQILWVDPTNRMACIQAGAVGRDIVETLAAYGYTMGHEPDSIEFSTLGGWIATHASGMKKNRYGNIEDIVLDVNVVTPQGVVSQSTTPPRQSIGIDARRWIFGSEGTLGIVTRAVVKIFPLPEVQQYDAMLFPDFASGVAFMYDLQRANATPASVRLMDNTQFQLGQTLKPAATGGLGALKSRIEKWFVTKIKGFDVDVMSACTLVYEGSRKEVKTQQAAAAKIAAKHGGLGGGSSNGERGYQLTFAIAYLRDFIFDHWIIGESFETSVPWSQAAQLCDNVKQRLRDEHARRGLPGKPFVTCRVTQLYETGVCIYFYFAIPYQGVENPSEVYTELEHIARDEILRSGGSLSHPHGVGKHRQGFLPQVVSAGTLACNDAL
ncbi:MAG: FAD-binding oxidoreductase, partial [Thermoleophilia bacterium]|nr:FAD-binding oxidoreductase [Thermoleophilia bacterium]